MLRRVASPLIVGLASVALLVGAVSTYLDRHVLDSRSFAERAAHTLDDEMVRADVARRLSEAIVAAQPDLIAGRPLIESGTEAIVGSAPFQGLFREAVFDLHRALFAGDQGSVVLTVADATVLVIDALRALSPSIAEKIPDRVQATLLSLSDAGAPRAVRDLARAGEDAHEVGILLPLLALALFALAIWLAGDRRVAVRNVGIGLAVAGATIVVAFEVGRRLAPGSGDERDALRLVWDAFLLDLRTWGFVIAAAGLTLAAGAASLLRPVELDEPAERVLRALLRTPASRRWRLLRALGLAAAGALVIAEQELVLSLALIGVGAALLYAGVSEVLRISLPAHRRSQPDVEVDLGDVVDDIQQELEEAIGRMRRLGRRLRPQPEIVVIALVALLVTGGAVAIAVGTDEDESAPLDIRACNGSAALCDRRLDEVVFAATHNSMSAASDLDWIFAQQDAGLVAQLDDGIRALLVDTHTGVRTPRGVYTVLEAGSKSREKIEASLGPRFIATAERLRGRIGFTGGGERRSWLCHGYCELGALDAVEALREVRRWLVAHPYEVVVLSIEDDTAPAETERVLRESGLLEMAWRGPSNPPFPTLRGMIETGERLVVLAESGRGSNPVIRSQFDVVRETPFTFRTPAALDTEASCRLNRGRPDAPLFLMNHWVDTSPAPRPSNARVVNARDFLLRRVGRCGRPNVLAVDFYRQGDLIEVVGELNSQEKGEP